MRKRLGGVLLSMMLLVSGCGYTTGSLLPSNYRVVFVAPIENAIDYLNQDQRKLYIPGLETRVRSVLIDRFLFDGHLRVGEKDDADLVMEAKLLSFECEDVRLTTAEDVKEYRLRVTVSLKLIDTADNNAIVWEEPSFAGEATYYTTGPLARSESAAIDDALKDLARRVIARTIEAW